MAESTKNTPELDHDDEPDHYDDLADDVKATIEKAKAEYWAEKQSTNDQKQ